MVAGAGGQEDREGLVREIVHIGIGVFDLEASVRFYRDVVGMDIEYRAHHEGEKISRVVDVPDATLEICVLRKGSVRLELIDYGKPEKKKVDYKDQSTPGLIHIAMKVSDVDEVYRRMKAMGYGFNSEPMVTRENGPKICYFRGPDNVVMELYELVK
jgi:catechol 2,3-dioxygenase-like lactoylglutathione lyase family enzyme